MQKPKTNAVFIDAHSGDLYLGNYPLAVFPRFCLVVKTVIPADVGFVAFIIVLGTAQLLANLPHQSRIAGKSCREAHIKACLRPVHELMAAEVAVAAKFDYRVWPDFV